MRKVPVEGQQVVLSPLGPNFPKIKATVVAVDTIKQVVTIFEEMRHRFTKIDFDDWERMNEKEETGLHF